MTIVVLGDPEIRQPTVILRVSSAEAELFGAILAVMTSKTLVALADRCEGAGGGKEHRRRV